MSDSTPQGAPGSVTEPGAPAPPEAERPRPQGEGMSERALGRAFLTPAFVVMGLLALFPIVYAAYESLFDFDFFTRTDFVGLANYVDQLTSPRFWSAVFVTIAFTVVSVTLEFIVGMIFALIMNAAFKGRNVTRAVILLPWVVPTVIAGQMWRYLFEQRPGYINEWLGLGAIDWLGSGASMFWAVVIADWWKTAPFVGLLLLAGLQTIPNEVYEAARVDGATWTQRFRNVTLPLLTPSIVVALLFRSVDALRIFDLADIMTNARLETLSVLAQRSIVRAPQPDIANTLAVLTFVMIMGIGLIFIAMMGRDVVGEPEEGS